MADQDQRIKTLENEQELLMQEVRALRERVGADYTFLSDPDATVLDRLNIRHHTPNPSGKDIAIPTQILVDKAGIVRWVYRPSNYRIRARPETVLAVLEDLYASGQ